MAITVELPSEVELALAEEASRRGVSLPEYAAQILVQESSAATESSAEQDAPAKPMTGAEIVAYWQREGLIGTRPDITDSQAFARELRRQAETRHWD